MRRLALLLGAVCVLGCAEGPSRAAGETREATVLILCLSDTATPESALCVEGAPSCKAWRRSIEGGREVWRPARDDQALENQQLCRASTYVSLPAPGPRPTWSRGGAGEVSRALARSK